MKKILVIFVLMGFVQTVLAQSNQCVVQATGFKSNVGKCSIYLYKAEKGFPKDFKYAITSASGTIENGKCRLVLKNIPKGKYAVVAHHDKNGNGKLDTNFLGMPKEGVGTSNNVKSRFGPPSFEDSTFSIVKPSNAINITIKYL
ncbi:MAG: DUF2141 domain-containing protein [Bacteroidota bacterium]